MTSSASTCGARSCSDSVDWASYERICNPDAISRRGSQACIDGCPKIQGMTAGSFLLGKLLKPGADGWIRIQGHTPSPSTQQRIKWSQQAAKALAHCHSCRVIRCDKNRKFPPLERVLGTPPWNAIGQCRIHGEMLLGSATRDDPRGNPQGLAKTNYARNTSRTTAGT
jgi:hypothetical protein